MTIDSSEVSGQLTKRPRRLRTTERLRALVRESRVSAEQLVMPHFVLPTDRAEDPVESMPGISRYGVKNLAERVLADADLGIRAVLLFGTPEDGKKNERGTPASSPSSAVARAVETLKQRAGDEIEVIIAYESATSARVTWKFKDRSEERVLEGDQLPKGGLRFGAGVTNKPHGITIVAASRS